MFLKPGLYLVATPIGNLGDITLRALDVLKNSDIIFCENTLISQKLLAKHNVKTKLQIYNDHSTDKVRAQIIEYIKNQKIVSLISDAGTPLISDPGYKLVQEVKEKHLFFDVIPGACSIIAALSLSSLETDRFYFAGFLPKTQEGKIKTFQELKSLKATLIFFESPKRVLNTLEVAYEVLGDRNACLAREITKIYREANTLPLKELINFYKKQTLKGEIVLLISKKNESAGKAACDLEIEQELKLLFKHDISTKTAAAIIAPKFKNLYSKSEIYKISNNIKNMLRLKKY